MSFKTININDHTDWWSESDEQRRTQLDLLEAAGVEEIRIDRGVRTMQPNKPTATNGGGWDKSKLALMDVRMQDIQDRGLKAVIMFGDGADWMLAKDSKGALQKNVAPAGYDGFADVVIFAAKRWAGAIAAVQICNEIDSNDWWTGGVATYAPFLKAVSARIRKELPDLRILASGLTHFGLDPERGDKATKGPLQLLVDAITPDVADICLHPYPGPSDAAPGAAPEKPAKPYWSIKTSTPRALAIINGKSKGWPVHLTEIGWISGATPAGADSLHRAVTEQQQADYTISAADYFAQFDQIKSMFVYDISTGTTGDSRLKGMNVATTGTPQRPKPVLVAIGKRNAANADPCAAVRVQLADALADRDSWKTTAEHAADAATRATASEARLRIRMKELADSE